MNIKPIAILVYAFFGTAYLVVGGAVLLFHSGLLPDTARNAVMNVAHGDMNTVHIIQELGSLLVFAGLITFWFIRRYERSTAFHWAMTTFWALFSLAHWFDGREGPRSFRGPAINTIPFAVFFLIGLFRATSETRRRRF